MPQQRAGAIGFEEIATIPRPGSKGLTQVAFSPDDRFVTYLGGDPTTLTRQLYAFDRETGETKQVIKPAAGSGEEETFSKEEQLRRERARIMSTGVTSYAWADKADRLLVPLDGALHVMDGVGSDAPLRRLFDPADERWAEVGSGPLLDPKLSADGKLVCFVWADEVCCCAVPEAADEAAPVRLTFGARGEGKTNGVADYCAQEEMDRYEGFWLSDDGGLLAFEEVDEGHIPLFSIARHGEAPHESEEHRYPFAGAANPKVRLGVVATGGGACGEGPPQPVWFDLSAPFGDDFYLARLDWAADGSMLAQVQSRDQRSLALLRLEPTTGAATPLLTERNEAWVNLHDMLRPLRGGGFLWASESDGWRHLYVHDAAGAAVRRLTRGEWPVEELVRVDEERGHVYIMGGGGEGGGDGDGDGGSVLQRHLYRVGLDGATPPERLTLAAGMHAGLAIAHDASCFVDQYSDAATPTTAVLSSLGAASPPRPISSASDDPRLGPMASVLRPPRFVSFASTDGAATLHASLYEPDAATFGPGPYPTVVSCYGGPHVQFVQDNWSTATADMRAQFLRSQGFLVLKVDGRGSDRRGLAFEAAIQSKLGSLEVDDQVAVVQHAVREGLADPARVGIYGWSYGGYLSAMALAKAPATFRCAVAGAPVTSWDGYDTHYTERYMGGTPQQLPKEYEASAVMPHVAGITGALMLVHGLVDENVHWRHTARLAQAMVDSQKSHELLCFPNERHSPRSLKDRIFMEQRLFAFLQSWLS